MKKSYDVIVLGGGGAALRAALAAQASNPDCQVALVTKGQLGQSGVTATACSDRMAFHVTLPFTEPGGADNWRYHAADIYELGGYVSDPELAEILARNSAEAFTYLDQLGVPFVKGTDGRPDQFVTDGSAYARACYTGPHTANDIEAALVNQIGQTKVEIINSHLAIYLGLDAQGAIAGVWLIEERPDAKPFFLAAPAVILATGGGGGLFAYNVYPPDASGDGYGLALAAGASLVNMEFIQIGLCSVKTKLACSGSMMRAIPRFINDRGEEFLWKQWQKAPQALAELVFSKGASWPVAYEHPSHFLDVAVAQEILAGRRVYLDYTANPQGLDFANLSEDLKAKYAREQKRDLGEVRRCQSPYARLEEINPAAIAWLAKRGIDLAAGEPVEIAPAIQHFQGGVRINCQAATDIPGLYAAGEVAGGQHGANRPGGNALLDCQVFGKIAGEAAAKWAQARKRVMPQGALPELTGKIPATQLRRELQALLARCAGVIRTAEGVQAGLTQVLAWQKQGVMVDAQGLAYAWETTNMLSAAGALLRAISARPESKGPHLFFASKDAAEPLSRGERDHLAVVLNKERLWYHSFKAKTEKE